MLWAAFLPLVLVFAYLRIDLGGARAGASAEASVASAQRPVAACTFPGQGHDRQRLVIGIVDSLRADTALNPEMMPWLASHTRDALWGYMQPCLSQLSLLCFRTMFEGSEPLLVTGFHNFSGMRVQAPSLVHRLAARGIRVAAVADQLFIKLYRPSLAVSAMFEERPREIDRDAYGRMKTFEWLKDPSLDVIVSHVIDTDAIAHRDGVGAPEYLKKFGETDTFLHQVAEQLGPRDSLIILGDHGHDAAGHHSTGIPATTAFFASGPWFPKGERMDLNQASLYFLAGAVTCEATPPIYNGQQPFDALTWPASTREAFRAASPPPSASAANVGFNILLDVPALAVGLLLLVLLLGALGGSVTPATLLVATLGLVAATVMPVSAMLAIATVGIGAIGIRQKAVDRRTAALLILALAVGLTGGLSASWVIVTLQANVNPTWTIGFWSLTALIIVALSFASKRVLELPMPLALGFTAWGVILYALFLGPYYYGAYRLLPFGLIALIAGFTAFASKREWRSLVPWLFVAAAPTIPILFPIMKEWVPQWFMLRFVQGRGPMVAAGASLGVFAAAIAVTRDPRAWIRPAVALVFFVATGIATQLAEWTLLGGVLVFLAYVAWMKCAERLAAAHPSGTWLAPIGQASFTLGLLFVLLGGYRFASVDFRFALALTPVQAGEAQAAAIALPLCIVKYLVPLALLLWSGPGVDARAAALVLLKLLVLGAGLLGMQISAAPSLGLFRPLQSQELSITVLVYAVVAIAHLARPAHEQFSRERPRTDRFEPEPQQC